MKKFRNTKYYCVCNETESHVFSFKQAQRFLDCGTEELKKAIQEDKAIKGFYIDEIEE